MGDRYLPQEFPSLSASPREKALHALCSLRKPTNLSKLPPFLANKIVEAIISPISLGYNAKNRLKKTRLHFCKRYLKVSNKASKVTCGAELGRFPLIIAIDKKIINNFAWMVTITPYIFKVRTMTLLLNKPSSSSSRW